MESWFVGLFVAEAFSLHARLLLAAEMDKGLGEEMTGRAHGIERLDGMVSLLLLSY